MMRWQIAHYVTRRLAAIAATCELDEGGVTAACEAMRRLNKYAKASGWDHERDEIYALKRRLIGELLEQYPCAIAAAVHRLPCNRCDGTGIWERWAHYADTCHKCGGTGVYREHELLCFRFSINGRRYSWHQPREFWSTVQPQEHDGEYKPEGDRGAVYLNDFAYELACETIAQWIEAQGLALPVPSRRPGISIADAVRADWLSLRSVLRSSIPVWWHFGAFDLARYRLHQDYALADDRCPDCGAELTHVADDRNAAPGEIGPRYTVCGACNPEALEEEVAW
jgi:hypothetical protein